ncbi:unnamed protein product [Phytophthora fragariaefolia]|uniref:Unnamed protein product n=1 Tax=Phytophthora fragariaefolia TaxID=1490495 RepID=A0A9W6YCR2_9STRA|nr:unnamed protein product [Phytophthora fragariaefolia]
MRCCSKRLGAFCVLRTGPPNHRLKEVWIRVTSTFARTEILPVKKVLISCWGKRVLFPECVSVLVIANGRDGAGGLDGADVAAARGGADATGSLGGADDADGGTRRPNVAAARGGTDVAAAHGGVDVVAVLGAGCACCGADVAAARRGAGVAGDHGGGDVAGIISVGSGRGGVYVAGAVGGGGARGRGRGCAPVLGEDYDGRDRDDIGASSSESGRDNDESEIDSGNDEGSAYVDEDNVGENSKADQDSDNSVQSIVSSTPHFQSPQPVRSETLTQERQTVAQL